MAAWAEENVWGLPQAGGAWANDVEEAEMKGERLGPQPAPVSSAAFPALSAKRGGDNDFPTLGSAAQKGAGGKGAKADAKKGAKKGKGKTMDLADFAATAAPTASRGAYQPPVRGGPSLGMGDLISQLPRAPKAKDGDDKEGWDSLAPGERPPMSRGDRDRDDRRGRFDGLGEAGRAEDDDDWRGNSQFRASSRPGEFAGRREGRGMGFEGSSVRADDVDDWNRDREFKPSEGGRGPLARRGPDLPLGRADDVDDWSRAKDWKPSTEPVRRPAFADAGLQRADDVDDWKRDKDWKPSAEPARRPAFADAGLPRADDVDDWKRDKEFVPGEVKADAKGDRRPGLASDGRADVSDNWGRDRVSEGPRPFTEPTGRERRGFPEHHTPEDSAERWGSGFKPSAPAQAPPRQRSPPRGDKDDKWGSEFRPGQEARTAGPPRGGSPKGDGDRWGHTEFKDKEKGKEAEGPRRGAGEGSWRREAGGRGAGDRKEGAAAERKRVDAPRREGAGAAPPAKRDGGPKAPKAGAAEEDDGWTTVVKAK